LTATRIIGCVAGRRKRKPVRIPTAATSANPAQRSNFRCERTGAGMTIPACDPLSDIHLNSLDRSPALCQRSSGSLARHFLITLSSEAGVKGDKVVTAGGSVVMIAATTFAVDLPSNARRPVTIS
jgi:hypothetical protein